MHRRKDISTKESEGIVCGVSSNKAKIEIVQVGDNEESFFDGHDVIDGLIYQHKYIPSKYYYDNVGSILFELQTQQPEYYLTRTEKRLLEMHIDEIIWQASPTQIVELGSGSSSKTKLVIQSHQKALQAGTYVPTDINRFMIETAANVFMETFSEWQIRGRVGTFQQVMPSIPPASGPRLFMFLGSTIGNLPDDEISALLQEAARVMAMDDTFLVGADLEKEKSQLEAAYNDRNGVAALTNLNVLSHLNWRFDGNIRTDQFQHWSFFNSDCHRMESHVVARNGQRIELRELDLSFEVQAGETIRTEIMRKFPNGSLERMFLQHGFELAGRWLSHHPTYGLFLFRPSGQKSADE